MGTGNPDRTRGVGDGVGFEVASRSASQTTQKTVLPCRPSFPLCPLYTHPHLQVLIKDADDVVEWTSTGEH